MQKLQKFSKLEGFTKLREQRTLFEKNALILLKSIFNKIGGAKNMPVVAGCFEYETFNIETQKCCISN